jgi:hypothetical protein
VKPTLNRAIAKIDLLPGEIACDERTDPEDEIRKQKGSNANEF